MLKVMYQSCFTLDLRFHICLKEIYVSAYFTKFRTLHDELECLSATPKCSCAKCTYTINEKLDVHDQQIKLTQFLMGLSEQFTNVRGQILLMKPLPSLSQTYAMLLQEENQRTSSGNHMNIESMALNVRNSSRTNKLGQNNVQSNSQGNFQKNYRRNNNEQSTLYCDYCHMNGHVKEKCYCLHGYPSWHRLFGKPKPKPRFDQNKFNSGNATFQGQNSTAGDSTDSKSVIHDSSFGNEYVNLTDVQCRQLIQYLQNSMKVTPNETTSGGSAWNVPSTNVVHFTGPYREEGPRDW